MNGLNSLVQLKMKKSKDIFDDLILPTDAEIREETRRENNKRAINQPEVSKSKSEKVKKLWANGRKNVVENIKNSITQKWNDPKYVETQKQGRAERYANPERCGNYKGPVIGTCKKTGKQITLIGIKQIKEAGFEPSNIYACVAGTRKSTGGYTWSRIE